MQMDYAVALNGESGFALLLGDTDGPATISTVLGSCYASVLLIAEDFNNDNHIGAHYSCTRLLLDAMPLFGSHEEVLKSAATRFCACAMLPCANPDAPNVQTSSTCAMRKPCCTWARGTEYSALVFL
jgi:hypothetical protein